jgi:hypothetical protein
MTAFAAVSGLLAQNINAAWQGSLKIGPQTLRIVFKISIDGGDHLKAEMYSIDQGSGAIPASAVTRDGAAVKIVIARIGANFEGKLSPDGNTIAGTWSQGGAPAPLDLTRATPATEWAIPEPPPPPKMMADDAKPSFEVATIKPSRPEEGFSLQVNRSGMLITTNSSLSALISSLTIFIRGRSPEYHPGAETERYDITAKPDTRAYRT